MLGANARIGNNNIKFSKVFRDLVDDRRDFCGLGDIGLIGASLCLILESKFFRSFWGCDCRAIYDRNLEEDKNKH